MIASPGGNSRPRSPSPSSSVVERRCCEAIGTVPAASAMRTSPGAGRGPAGGDAEDVGGRDQRLAATTVAGAHHLDALAQAPARSAARSSRRPGRRPPTGGRATAAAPRAGRGAARPAPPRGRTRSAAGAARGAVPPGRARPPGLGRGVRARLERLVGAGEEALDQLRRGPAAHRAGVEAAEEDLDQRAGHLGREDALAGLVEAADVERGRVTQRRRSEAGDERVVDVNDVEIDARRAAHRAPGWRRPADAPPGAADRGASGSRCRAPAGGSGVAIDPDPAGAVEQRRRSLGGGGDRPPRLAHSRPRVRGSGGDDAMPARRELGRDPGHELVDLVSRPPRMGAYVRDREPVAGRHPDQDRRAPPRPGRRLVSSSRARRRAWRPACARSAR